MKDGLRFVDSDMHVMEPPDLFERYLDPKFKDRVSVPSRGRRPSQSRPGRHDRHRWEPDLATPTCSSTASARAPAPTQSTQPLSGSRIFDTGRLDFAIERNYNPEAQVMGMAMEGVDIAVLYPTTGLASSRATTWIRSSRSRSARRTTTGSTSSAATAPSG